MDDVSERSFINGITRSKYHVDGTLGYFAIRVVHEESSVERISR